MVGGGGLIVRVCFMDIGDLLEFWVVLKGRGIWIYSRVKG